MREYHHFMLFNVQGGTWSSILLLDQVVDKRGGNHNTTKTFKDGDVIFDNSCISRKPQRVVTLNYPNSK